MNKDIQPLYDKINNLRDTAFQYKGKKKDEMLKYIEGYHDAVVDTIFQLGLQELLFKKSVI